MGGANMVVSSPSGVYAVLESEMTRFTRKSSPCGTNKTQSTLSELMGASTRYLIPSYDFLL